MFLPEDDDHKEIIFSGETKTLTFQLVKIKVHISQLSQELNYKADNFYAIYISCQKSKTNSNCVGQKHYSAAKNRNTIKKRERD